MYKSQLINFVIVLECYQMGSMLPKFDDVVTVQENVLLFCKNCPGSQLTLNLFAIKPTKVTQKNLIQLKYCINQTKTAFKTV